MAKLEIPAGDFELNLTLGSTKAAMKDAGAGSTDLWKVHPSKIKRIPGFNGRIRTPGYLAHLAHIKNSIAVNGYYPDKPLAGFVAKDEESGKDVIYLTEGHTRLDAVDELIAEGAEIDTVPIVIKPKGTDMEDLTVALARSNDGLPFTVFETALLVKRLHLMGMDEKTIAVRLNFKTGKRYVDDLLLLAGAPKAIRDMLIADKITASMAIEQLKSEGSKATENLKAAVKTAAEKGRDRASPKHLPETAKTAKAAKKAAPAPAAEKAAKPAKDAKVEKPSIRAIDVLLDAEKCGFAINTEVDEKILKLAATLLDRFGIEVYDEEADDSDPADGL